MKITKTDFDTFYEELNELNEGIVFSDKAKRAQIKDLLNTPGGMLILRRLQAGRMLTANGVNVPYRLSDEELKKLENEFIYYEQGLDGTMYARFEKPVNEIRELLGLEPQDPNPFNLK